MCLNHKKKEKVDQVFKPTLAYFFQNGSWSAVFHVFRFLAFLHSEKKTKQVSMKASKDNLKKVVDHGFKPVCLVDHVFEPSFKQQHCLRSFSAQTHICAGVLNNDIAGLWGEVDHVFKPQKKEKVDQVFKPTLAYFFQNGSWSAIFRVFLFLVLLHSEQKRQNKFQ